MGFNGDIFVQKALGGGKYFLYPVQNKFIKGNEGGILKIPIKIHT